MRSRIAAAERTAYAPISRFSRTLMRAKTRRPSGTCPKPSRAIASGRMPVTLLPRKRIWPDVARTKPLIARSVVVFPAPFAPRSATISPSSTFSEMPRSARIPP